MNPTEDQTPEDGTPPGPPAAPPQAAIPVGELSSALVDAYRQITAAQPRPAHVVADPIDSLTAEQKQQLQDRFITDPLGAARQVSDMGAAAERARMYQQAAPMITNQANTIVELFKTKKMRNDKYFTQVEPLFDRLMVGVDVTPLVSMNRATAENELEMRWKNARSDVLEIEMRKIKPEPTLLASSPGSAPPPLKVSDDPWMANMAKQYGYTKEQMEELESIANG